MAKISRLAGALKESEFRTVAARFTRMSDKALQVAHAVLVEGRTPDSAAAQFDTSRQLAHQWATKLYEAFTPAGWITASVTLPPELMAQVREMERDARTHLEASQPDPRIVRR